MKAFTKGQIVYALSGRDAKKHFIVYDILSEDFVLIVNGNLRTVEKPKKKNVKHLMGRPYYVDGDIQELLKSSGHIENAHIRKAINKFFNTQSEEGLGV